MNRETAYQIALDRIGDEPVPVPLHDRVVVLRDVQESVTKGGIELPEEMLAREGKKLNRGTVLAIGPGRWAPFYSGEKHDLDLIRYPVDLRPGTQVAFEPWAGHAVQRHSAAPEFVVLRETEIICRFDG